MKEVTLYGVRGCGPCEVTKMYLTQKGVPYRFVDLQQDEPSRRDLRERLESPTSGVILEHDGELELMQGVSVGKLNRWYRGYRERHP